MLICITVQDIKTPHMGKRLTLEEAIQKSKKCAWG